MKLFIIIYFTIAIISLPFAILAIRKKTSFSIKMMKALLIACTVVALTYFCSIIFMEQMVVKVFYSIYIGAMNFLTLSLALYLHAETGRIKKFEKRFIFYYMISIIDLVNILLNLKFNHVMNFNFNDYYFKNIISFTPTPIYYVHLSICYLPLIFGIMDTIRTAYITPRYYRRTYFVSLIVVGILILINAIYLATDMKFDFTIGLYGISGIILLYFSLVLTPNKLKEKLSELLIATNDFATVLFDINGKTIISNEKYCIWANQLEVTYDKFKNFILDAKKISENTYEKVFVKSIDGEERTFICQVTKLTYINHQGVKRELGDIFNALDITEKVKEQMANQIKLRYDELTGLYTFSYFSIVCERILKENLEKKYVFVVDDIKEFKVFNGLMGMEAGNEVICNFSNVLRNTIKSKNVIYCRIGSDKFGVFGERNIIINFLENNPANKNPLIYKGYQLHYLTGIYEILNHNESIKAMYPKALLAIENMKKNGNNTTQIYDEQIYERIIQEQEVINSYKNAIENKEFNIYIQPQYMTKDKKLCGGEALVRWNKNGKLISPGLFIPVLEKKGVISELDKYVWENVCVFLKEMNDKGNKINISVNVSAQDIFSFDVFEYFKVLVNKYNIEPSQLRIEITESNIISDIKFYIDLICRFNQAGFIVEMDDFGSGYSSLNTLKNIPVNVLKMDMKFLDDINSERGRTVIELVFLLSKRLNIPVIAEGVETKVQFDFLKNVGCEMIQGYYLGKPMPQEEFIKLINIA